MNLPDAFRGGRVLPSVDIREKLPRLAGDESSRVGARGISDSASLGQPICKADVSRASEFVVGGERSWRGTKTV
jgi:hypothetical protein